MKLKLKIPTNWAEITMEQYVKLVGLIEKFDLEKPDELLKYRLEQTAILNPDYTTEVIGKMTLEQLKDYFKKIEFLDTRPVLKECKVLEIDGKKYEFQDFKLMSLEQWIDTEKYYSLDKAHKLIAIFYIKADEYNAAEHEKVANYLLKAPATEYFWSVSFFLFIHKAFGLAIELYSENLQKKELKAKKMVERMERADKRLKAVQKVFGFK